MDSSLLMTAFAATVFAGIVLAGAVNFDNFPAGTAPPGWTATKTGTGDAKWTVEKDDTAPSKPNVLKQSGQATLSRVHQGRHESEGRFRGSEVQAHLGSRGSGRWPGVAREGCEQLLRGPRECSRRQRDHLPHHQRAPHGEEPGEHEGCRESMAHACESNFRVLTSP